MALLPTLLVFAFSSTASILYKRKFSVNDPSLCFNIIVIVIFSIFIVTLFFTPGSGAFAIFLFSIFFAPFVFIIFNILFQLINYLDNKKLERSKETLSKVPVELRKDKIKSLLATTRKLQGFFFGFIKIIIIILLALLILYFALAPMS